MEKICDFAEGRSAMFKSVLVLCQLMRLRMYQPFMQKFCKEEIFCKEFAKPGQTSKLVHVRFLYQVRHPGKTWYSEDIKSKIIPCHSGTKVDLKNKTNDDSIYIHTKNYTLEYSRTTKGHTLLNCKRLINTFSIVAARLF